MFFDLFFKKLLSYPFRPNQPKTTPFPLQDLWQGPNHCRCLLRQQAQKTQTPYSQMALLLPWVEV